MNRKKRAYVLFIAFVMLLGIFAGCKTVDNNNPSSVGFLPAFAPYYANHITGADEFGVARYNQGHQENLSYGIFFPEIGQAELDALITSIVSDFINTYAVETAQGAGTAELHINYASTKLNDNIASIRFYGFVKTGEGESLVETPIAKGLLLNLQTNTVIDPAGALNAESGETSLQEALGAKLKEQGYEIATDGLSSATMFDAALFTKTGARFTFPASTLSAAQEEETTVSLEYDEFSRAFSESFAELLGVEINNGLHNPNIDPNKPMIALTFDDGPSNVTPKLLDLLDQYGGQATFYIVGSRIEQYKSVLQDTANRGHEIACHTWDHKYLTKQSHEDAIAAMQSVNDKVYEYTGQRVTTMRPPGGFYNDSTKEQCKSLGLSIIMWGVDTRDWETREANSVYQKAINGGIKDGSIILCHDLYESTYQGMTKLIPYLVEQGYQLVTVSDLLQYKGLPIGGGEVYNKAEAPKETPVPSGE